MARKKKKAASGEEVKHLVSQYFRMQEHRMAFTSQVRTLKKEGKETALLEEYAGKLQEIEKDLYKELARWVCGERLWKEFLKDVKGIGPVIAAGTLRMVDINKAQHVSSLWKFAGMDVTAEGKAPRLTRGQKTTWNPQMRMLCWKIARSFLMLGSPYREVYDKRKEHEEREHKDLRPIQIHIRAQRYMVKMFLKDLWVAWRTLEGLPVTEPYVIAKLGHDRDPKQDVSRLKVAKQKK